jgi:N-methylhydantoinase A/oxoprolinase/acetone carboxylase beta subunit
MESEARRMLADAGEKAPKLTRSADLRFVGQGFELQASVPAGKLTLQAVKRIEASFHAVYQSIYESVPGTLPIEAMTWRLRASGPAPRVSASLGAPDAHPRTRKPRLAFFPELRKFVKTPVYDRYALKPSSVIHGPAIVEERESTAVIGPRGRGRIDKDLNLVIEIVKG